MYTNRLQVIWAFNKKVMFSIEATSSKQSELDRSIPSSKSIFKIQQGYIFPNLPSLTTSFYKRNTFPCFSPIIPVFLPTSSLSFVQPDNRTVLPWVKSVHPHHVRFIRRRRLLFTPDCWTTIYWGSTWITKDKFKNIFYFTLTEVILP